MHWNCTQRWRRPYDTVLLARAAHMHTEPVVLDQPSCSKSSLTHQIDKSEDAGNY